ncbi:MAG: lipase family protein [Clostridia bacterium]|nr:lipase family protein [Clostridia bacterium]
MNLSQLFRRCVERAYIHVENAGDYATDRIGETLYIYLQASDGLMDWKNNLDFPAKPYRRMGHTVWFAHRGFLRVWKSIAPHLEREVMDGSVKRIITVGYSHGAALAVLCHEDVWYRRPDLRETLEGYGFGCPRVFWGLRTRELMRRWEHFTVIRNIDDLVTHVPPVWLGYSHVGSLLEIGEREKYTAINAHRPQNILAELQRWEQKTAATVQLPLDKITAPC